MPLNKTLSALQPEATRESLRAFASVATAAYGGKLVAWPHCSIRHVENEETGMSAIVIADDETIVVSICGTEPGDYRDVLRDANCRWVPHPMGGRVHQGFWFGWRSIEDQVQHAIEGLQFYKTALLPIIGTPFRWAQKRLFVTGHSMGGAVATLAQARLGASLCVTFGSPRVVDSTLARLLDRNMRPCHLRVTHGNDFVPRLPFPIEYRHCGTHVLIDRKNRLRIDPSYWRIGVDRVLGFRCDMLRDHRIRSYAQSLD